MAITPQIVSPSRKWVQRGLWALDSYSRVLTVVAVGALGVAIGGGIAAVVRAVSKLPTPWVFVLWGSVGMLAFVVALIAVLRVHHRITRERVCSLCGAVA